MANFLRLDRAAPSENELFLTQRKDGSVRVEVWTFDFGTVGFTMDDYEVGKVREWLAAIDKPLPAQTA